MFIFERWLRNWAKATPAKFIRDIQWLTCVLTVLKIWENNGENWLCNPHPWFLSYICVCGALGNGVLHWTELHTRPDWLTGSSRHVYSSGNIRSEYHITSRVQGIYLYIHTNSKQNNLWQPIDANVRVLSGSISVHIKRISVETTTK